jgi:hypothetical protein
MLAVYGHLVGASSTGYASGGIVTMPSSVWARGGKVERPTLLTGEDGKKFPEFVIGTNPAFAKNNIQALTAAANRLGVPMARKSKTGTVKPHLVGRRGGDAENLPEVKNYSRWQQAEQDKSREISIAESRVREPDTLIKQQGTDELGNPIYVVDQAKIDAYVGQMAVVKKLYDDLINRVMAQLAESAQRAYAALDRYRQIRLFNMRALDAQNKINHRLMRSKDKDVRKAAERRYDRGVELREDQRQKRSDAWDVRQEIASDQHDAGYRIQEYGISRQSVADDMVAVGTRAAQDAAAETSSAYQPPETPEPPEPQPTAGEAATARLETELALARAGYGMNGRLGSQRDIADIINDLVAANQTQITEAQSALNDNDSSNDQDAYSKITQAANAIQGLKEELANMPTSPEQIAIQGGVLGGALQDLYRSFGGNFSLAQSGLGAGRQAADTMMQPFTIGGGTVPSVGTAGGGTTVINIEQNFPTQPDPRTWAASTMFELKATL